MLRRRTRIFSPAASPCRSISIVDDLEALECQLGIDFVDVLAVFREERGQPTSGNDAADAVDLTLDALEDTVDQRQVSEVDPRLHVDDRVRTDDVWWTAD